MSRRFAPTAWKIAEVFCSSRNILESVKAKMKAAITLKNIKTSVGEITLIPQTTIELAGDEATKMMKLMDALEEHDDVQEVYANFDIPEDLI